jgi:hypothetical protein
MNAMFSTVFTNRRPFVGVVDATQKTQRQAAQRGLFLCPGDAGYPFWRNLASIDALHSPDAMYHGALPGGERRYVLSKLAAMDVDRSNLLPSAVEVEALCHNLADVLRQSQANCGHFQWKVSVKPLLMAKGLLEADLEVVE